MIEKIGRATLRFQNMPSVAGYASVVGKKELEGPLGEGFDRSISDSYNGCETYEEAEAKMQRSALNIAAGKCGIEMENIDCVFAGDLLNQCIGSSFGLKNLGIPYLGQYAACSTMAQNLIMASVFVESGAANIAACATSSHFCSAERQYRFPMEYGSVRTPTAQWTVTGAGGCLLTRAKSKLRVAAASVGKITDLEVTDVNNMGAAMAPAVFLKNRHRDCGMMIFDRTSQDVHAGGSGCGCCASVLCSEILNGLRDGKYKNILFMATGALLSVTSVGQKKTIPSIAHLVYFKSEQ